jgi:hypothetical protein
LELNMLVSLVERFRTPLTIIACGVISFLLIKVFIWDTARRIDEVQAEAARVAEESSARHDDIESIRAQLEQIRVEAQHGYGGGFTSGRQQAGLIELLVPDNGISRTAFQEISVDGETHGNYSFTVGLAASFAGSCEYLRWLEHNRLGVVIRETTLSPLQKDTTQVYLQLAGVFRL